MRPLTALVVAAFIPLFATCAKEIKVGPEEARVIAEEAYIYGLPIVENYKVLYNFAVYRRSGSFKAPFNHLALVLPDTTAAPDTTQTDSIPSARVLVPPYALSWLDLRKEPVVISVAPMREGTTFHVQLVDLYTHNFGAITSSEAGVAGGSYLIVHGTGSGDAPEGIARVIPCETTLALAIIRPQEAQNLIATELFLDRFSVETLSQFERKPAKKPDALIFPPYSKTTAQTAGFFQYLNFALQFCPVHPGEIELRARFAKLGIAAGKSFNVATADPARLEAIQQGMTSAKAAIAEAAARTPEDALQYGSRAELENDYLARAVAATVDLYGPAPR